MTSSFPFRGIISVLQTPFDTSDAIDTDSLARLVGDAIDADVDGFLVPVVASEVAALRPEEREQIVRAAVAAADGRVPTIVGASSDDARESAAQVRLAEAVGAAAVLVAVPEATRGDPRGLVAFLRGAATTALPLIVQDLDWSGPGLPLETIRRLLDELPNLAGLKIETRPAGPAYTAARESFGPGFFIAGGWAVPQMIEALDRGVDAMIPESSMVRVYARIDRAYRGGDRARGVDLFRRLLPVLAFSNQELDLSIAFFKRLLVRKGIFRTERLRSSRFRWDRHGLRIADELIDLYLELEHEPVDGDATSPAPKNGDSAKNQP